MPDEAATPKIRIYSAHTGAYPPEPLPIDESFQCYDCPMVNTVSGRVHCPMAFCDKDYIIKLITKGARKNEKDR